MKTCNDCRKYKVIDKQIGICSVKEMVVEHDDEICEYFDDLQGNS